MATKVVMEALSPTMEEGRLVKWLKNEGDAVAKGDPIAEVETDKAVMELVARGDGVLRKRIAGEGQTAAVGSLVAVIAAADEDIDALITGGASPPAQPPAEGYAPATSRPAAASGAPTEGARMEKAKTAAPELKPGGPPPPPSPPPGPETSLAGRRGNAAPKHQAPPLPQPATEQPPHAGDGDRVRSSPLARRLAAEQGLELGRIEGTGPAGRIIKRDIEAALKSDAEPSVAAAQPSRAATGDFEDIPLSQMRKTIARRLAESIGPIPTFYLTAEFDMERVAEMRAAMMEMGEQFKVSVNDIVLKAVATALALHPEVNAHWLGDRIRKFKRVHLGMAVAIDEGLITPVVFDADSKRLSEIALEARALAARARDRKLKPDEYTGSTFSVSNLGMFGIDQFTAIINPPEAGILAIGTLEAKPVAGGGGGPGGVEFRKRMRVTMSCDHRVIDGATGAKFLQTLRRMLENPLMLVF
ncbi:MAG: dihydrolipoamide acetyltransferase family protein [Gemmatimonadaceae bacterium]